MPVPRWPGWRRGRERTAGRIPAQLRVLVTPAPEYACRRSSEAVAQAYAPEHVVAGGVPPKRLIAQIIVAKFCDHLPFYRQSEINAARASGWIARHWGIGQAESASI
jgi:transposase